MILKKSLFTIALMAALSSAHAATSSKVFTVSNVGDGAMTLSNKRITGSGAANYSISGDTCTSAVAAGGNCSMTVSFTPTAGVSYPAALEYDSNATGGSGAIQLSGAGQAVAALPSKVEAIYGSAGSAPCGGTAPFLIAYFRISTTSGLFTVNKITSAVSGWSLVRVLKSNGSATAVVNPLPSTVATTGYSWAGSAVDTSYNLEMRYGACGGAYTKPTSITFAATTGATETWTGTWPTGAGTVTWTKQ